MECLKKLKEGTEIYSPTWGFGTVREVSPAIIYIEWTGGSKEGWFWHYRKGNQDLWNNLIIMCPSI
jgi:hypothetical protein